MPLPLTPVLLLLAWPLPPPPQLDLMVSLEAFADSLDAKMLVAICADESEMDVEGPYWLRCFVGRRLCSTRTRCTPASSTARAGSSRPASGTGFGSAASGAMSCCPKRCVAGSLPLECARCV